MLTFNSPQTRANERAELDAMVAEHLASGGTITKLAHNEFAPLRGFSYNRAMSHKIHHRRQYEAQEKRIADRGRALASIGLTVLQARKQMQRHGITASVMTLEQIAAKYGYAYADLDRNK